MFKPEKSIKWLRKNAPAGAEWATIDGEFFYKIVDDNVLMFTSVQLWMPSAQLADDIRNSYFFVNLQPRKEHKMPKFCVKIKEVHTQVIEVEAESKHAALAAAQQVVNTGVLQDGSDLPANVEYEYTLDFDESNVWKAE